MRIAPGPRYDQWEAPEQVFDEATRTLQYREGGSVMVPGQVYDGLGLASRVGLGTHIS